MLSSFFSRFRRAYLRWDMRRHGAHIASDVQCATRFANGDLSRLTCGPGCYFSKGSTLLLGSGPSGPGRLTLGKGVFVNRYAIIDCHDNVEIGDRVMIGPHAYIGDFDHDTRVIEGPTMGGGNITAPVRISHDVWIGAHAVVLKGVSIGAGAVVAASACVVSDVPALAIVAGVPARLIKMREGSSSLS